MSIVDSYLMDLVRGDYTNIPTELPPGFFLTYLSKISVLPVAES